MIRMREIKATISAASVGDLLDCLQAARSPRRLVKCLGLERHPGALNIKHPWDASYRKVVYHSDATSIYGERPLLLQHVFHNVDSRCSKELSIRVGQGEERTRRVLKAWALLGHSLPDKAAHVADSQRNILLAAVDDGTLMPEAELDLLEVATADAIVTAPFVARSHVEGGGEVSQAKHASKAEPASQVGHSGQEETQLGTGSADVGRLGCVGAVDMQQDDLQLLGRRSRQVPQQVHMEMLKLARVGGVPRTSLAQRERNKLSSATNYGVPANLKTALAHGYIHPNLPPPQGYEWRFQAGKCKLEMKGG